MEFSRHHCRRSVRAPRGASALYAAPGRLTASILRAGTEPCAAGLGLSVAIAGAGARPSADREADTRVCAARGVFEEPLPDAARVGSSPV